MKAQRMLAALLAVGFLVGFLLTPLGFETRRKMMRTLAFAAFFIAVGLLLPLAGLVALGLGRQRLAGTLAMIDAALLFLTAPADQARLFFTVPPPPAVTVGELVLVLLGTGYMVSGQRLLRNGSTASPPGR